MYSAKSLKFDFNYSSATVCRHNFLKMDKECFQHTKFILILIIDDIIIRHNLDFMFLTGIWLDGDNSAAVLIESTPPNFSVMSEARVHKKESGAAILFNNPFQASK